MIFGCSWCFLNFYLLYEVLCHMLAYDILQSLMVYVEWVINIDAEENRFQDWPFWYTKFNSSFRRVGTMNKDTLYSIFKIWTEKDNEFKLYKETKSFESKILWATRSNVCVFKSKKTSLDRSDLFIAENHKSVNCASRALQECLQQKPNWSGWKRSCVSRLWGCGIHSACGGLSVVWE